MKGRAVVWLLAAFPDGSFPAVTAIRFGIHHNLPAGAGYFLQARPCGPSPLEAPDEGWPEPNDCGNLVAFESPVYDRLFKFYIFGVYLEPGQFLGTRTYPTRMRRVRRRWEPTPRRSDLQFRHDPMGSAWRESVSNGPRGGSMLFRGRDMLFILANECDAQGGMAQGPDTTCDPNPCPVYQACCFDDGNCQVLPADACVAQGGFPQGEGTSCEPNVCASVTPAGPAASRTDIASSSTIPIARNWVVSPRGRYRLRLRSLRADTRSAHDLGGREDPLPR